MTQFRGREEQTASLERHMRWDAKGKAASFIEEAEARGAEEARRVDAEEQEPVAYEHVMTYETDETNERLSYSPENAFGKPGKDYSAEYPVVITSLYARPANVTALEARIAELEAALSSVRDAIENADPAVLICTLWMRKGAETVCDFISAALTREGGV